GKGSLINPKTVRNLVEDWSVFFSAGPFGPGPDVMKVIRGFDDGHEVSQFDAVLHTRDAIAAPFPSVDRDALGRRRITVSELFEQCVAQDVRMLLERLPVGIIAFVVRQDKN